MYDASPDLLSGHARHGGAPLRTRFAVVERRRDGRQLWFLELEFAPGGWKQWLLPREPPLEPGIRRVAIERRDDHGDPAARPDNWDDGLCTFEVRDDVHAILEFSGRRLRGHYVLTRTRPGHWLLYLGRERGDVRFALSAGGVVLRDGPRGPEVVLVRPHRRRYWSLPKGTVEPDESLEAAAVREVAEETGVHARIVRALDPVEYWFWTRTALSRQRVHKAVAWYAMTPEYYSKVTDTREIAEVRWFPRAGAMEQLGHGSFREVLQQAMGEG